MVETDQQSDNFVRFPERVDILDALCTIENYSPEYEPLFALVAERLSNKAYDRSAFVFILIELIYEFEVTDREFSQLLSQSVLALTDDIYLAASALDAYQEVKVTLAPIEEPLEEEGSSAEEEGPSKEGVAEAVAVPAEQESPEESAGETVGAVRAVSTVKDSQSAVEDSPSTVEDSQSAVEDSPSAVEDRGAVEDSEGTLEARLSAAERRESSVSGAEMIDPEQLMFQLQKAQKRITDQGLSTRMAIEMTLGRPDRGSVRESLAQISSLRHALREFEELLREGEEQILRAIGVLGQDS